MFKKLLTAITCLSLLSFSSDSRAEPAVETNTPKEELYLIYFGADWCIPCQQIKKILEDPEVQKEVSKFSHDLKNGKPYPYYIDTDKQPDVVKTYNIQAIPTLIIVKVDDEEVKVVKRLIGSADKAAILRFLNQGKATVNTSAEETIIIPPVWTIKGVILILFKIIKAILG